MDCFASINSASPVTGTFAARAADPAGEIWMLSFDSSSKSRTLCTTASVWISRICSNFGQCLIVAFPWPFSKSWIEIIVYRFHFADFRELQKKSEPTKSKGAFKRVDWTLRLLSYSICEAKRFIDEFL